MILYVETFCALLLNPAFYVSWILLSLLIIWFNSKQKKSQASDLWDKSSLVILFGVITFIILAWVYVYLGCQAPHGYSDDISIALQTYLSSSRRGDSLNWTNSLMGGMDRWLLPNSQFFSLGRILAYFLELHQLYLVTMLMNVVGVFYFAYRIQREYFNMPSWAAYIGSVAAAFVQGYWTGEYAQAHVAYGSGYTVMLASIYILTCVQEKQKHFVWACVTMAIALVSMSWVPIHLLPTYLVGGSLWGLIFWKESSVKKACIFLFISILVAVLMLSPQLGAILANFDFTARAASQRLSIDLANVYSWVVIGMGLCVVLSCVLLGLWKDLIFRRVSLMMAGLSLLPLIGFVFQSAHIFAQFRWHLLYLGNHALLWMGFICWISIIIERIKILNKKLGVILQGFFICVMFGMFVTSWMNSTLNDIVNSYPHDNLSSFTDSSISSLIKPNVNDPYRIAGIDDTNDMHFFGQITGLENASGYTPFIDKRKVEFWWNRTVVNSQSSDGVLGLPINHKYPHNYSQIYQPISFKKIAHVQALRLMNIKWVVTHHPLEDHDGLILEYVRDGQLNKCSVNLTGFVHINPRSINRFSDEISCYIADAGFIRPLYVYRVVDVLPRVYMAKSINTLNDENNTLTEEETNQAAEGHAFVAKSNLDPATDIYLDSGHVDLIKYESDFMAIRIAAADKGLVVISSTLGPGWALKVDGKPRDLIEVNKFQKGFMVDAEDRVAELGFCPPGRFKRHEFCKGL